MRELMSYLPELYEHSPEMIAIQQAIEPELRLAWNKRDDLLLQLDPHTATWGLVYWENAFGLTSNEALPLELRRNRVLARLRGMGTTTKERLKSVVETFCPGCAVSVREHYREYLVEIGLTITNQAIEDSNGLTETLQLIMPAHLVWGFSIQVESEGGILYGACAELAGKIDVWPMVPRVVEVTSPTMTAGVLSYHGVVEIYPEGGETYG